MATNAKDANLQIKYICGRIETPVSWAGEMGENYWLIWLLTAALVAANKVERPGDHIVVGCFEVSLMDSLHL